jgi:alkyl hydroperoxide reductase subunit AhpF
MTPMDEQTIRAWAAERAEPATILLARGQGDRGERLALFCDQLKVLAPGVKVKKATKATFRSPALIVGRHQNIAYQAVPEGRELPPFLEALRAAAGAHSGLAPDLAAALNRIELPAELTLYIAMQCPHCPQAVTQLLSLCAAAKPVRLAIVDGLLFAEAAAAHAVRSVPTLILDDQLRWSGPIDIAEVVRQCIERNPDLVSAASLRQILEAGDAPRAAAMMIARGRIFPALIALLTHERWSVRLGAMVTVEYLADEAPDLALRLVDPLWERFAALPEQVQGDVVQVLGRIGGAAGTRCLQAVAAGDFAASVREAAAEELEGGPAL